MKPDHPKRQVNCPACGGPSLYSSANTFRPFCGERCKQIDLGSWASERFALPAQTADNSPEFGES
jgi:uncharacterized protein